MTDALALRICLLWSMSVISGYVSVHSLLPVVNGWSVSVACVPCLWTLVYDLFDVFRSAFIERLRQLSVPGWAATIQAERETARSACRTDTTQSLDARVHPYALIECRSLSATRSIVTLPNLDPKGLPNLAPPPPTSANGPSH